MSKRDWLFFTAVGGLLAFGLAFAALQNEHKSRCARCNAAYQYDSANPGNNSSSVGTANQAPIDDPKPSRDEWREEQNLQAQRDMATWSLLMAIFSGLSVGITGLGVWYVAGTLKATRDAVRLTAKGTEAAQRAAEAAERTVAETTRIGESQVRAYLTIKDVRVSFKRSSPKEKRLYIEVSVSVKNSGNSPARDFFFNVSVLKIIGADVEQFNRGIGMAPLDFGVEIASGDLFQDSRGIHSLALTETEIAHLEIKNMMLYVGVQARFFDVFGRQPHRLNGNYVVRISKDGLDEITVMHKFPTSPEALFNARKEAKKGAQE